MSNFYFLEKMNPIFLQIADSAENNIIPDPNTTLIKLRQLGEAIAQDVAARIGIDFDQSISQVDLLYKISRELKPDQTIMDLFHKIRKEGNRATHQFDTHHREAMDGIKVARELSIWYFRSFQDSNFKPKKFIALTDPSTELRSLQTDILKLKTQLLNTNEKLENNLEMNALLAK
ncbi:MAG: DUF4145 domain-containing protein [Spirochaetales bacterium]|nr:DUF4145 domain-containing protein [Spirochaetales bacterium]